MSSSKLLEQAIVDAQALRDSAYKSAQASLVEKFAPQIKEAVEKLLEQEETAGADTPSPSDSLAGGDSSAPLTDFGGAPPDESNKGYVSGKAKDVPLAATDGEKLCACPDDDQEMEIELNLGDLTKQLMIGREAEKQKDFNQQPLAGMQDQPPAAGGTGLTESLELESIELDENVEVNLDEVLAEGEDEEDEEDEEGDEDEEDDEDDEDDEDEESDEEEDLEEVKKIKKKMTPQQKKLAAKYGDPKKITRGDVVAARIASGKGKEEDKKEKTNESTVKQLMSTSAQLLKEHQNTVKLVEKKDSQIKNLLEENKKFSSTIEEMSNAFKKLEEVNLLNAHLFYQNQILKSASLNERQKIHIVEAISKADSVNEAKTVYETLINSVGGTAEKERSPKSLNEVISKKSSFRLPHKQAEQPHDPGKDRWLKLAGIK
jgi:hypothetical protein